MLITTLLLSGLLGAGPVDVGAPSAVASSALAVRGDEPADEVVRLFDLRGLDALLGPAPARGEAGSESMWDESRKVESHPTPLTSLLDRLAYATDVRCEKLLFDNIVLVQGTEDAIEEFSRRLEQVEALYGERYEVEVVCYRVTGETPRLGSAAAVTRTEGALLFEARQVAVGGQQTPLTATTDHVYVADVTPVVATQARAFDPDVATAAEGIDLTVMVDGAPGAKRFDVRIGGTLRSVSFRGVAGADLFDPPVPGLPVVMERRVASTLSLPGDRLTVAAILSGFDGPDRIAVAVAVRQMD